MARQPSPLEERADAIELAKADELDSIMWSKSALANMEDGRLGTSGTGHDRKQQLEGGKHFWLGEDPRLPKLPEKPTLLDYFRCRMRSYNHLLQSATHALKAGMPEKTILACLLHDMSNALFLKSDHGYWSAQLIEPYVDEEVSWAIRSHQALRFFPDESVGYEYPQLYINYYGPDYEPDDYLKEEYERARNHKWYMTSRLICVHDIYSFDRSAKVNLDDFVDIVGRNFRQPKEGLGYDNSPVAHMWRTIRRPAKYA